MIGIVFDCDGTLIDSEAAHFASWRMAIEKRGGSLTAEEYQQLAGKTGTAISGMLHAKVMFDSPEALRNDKIDYYMQMLRKQEFQPIERTVRFIKELSLIKKELGLKLAVASAARKEEILHNLEHLKILSLFDAIVSGVDDLTDYSDPEGVNKPKPYIYLHAAKLLGLPPAQCVAFEDSATGLLAAVTAGMITIAVPNQVTQLQDFSRADYIIDPATPIDIDDFFLKVDLLRQAAIR